FLRSRPGEAGRWEFVEHSHPVDPTRGVTTEAQRFPSGYNGDYDGVRADAIARGGKPVQERIGIVTERGNETVTFGYDPNDPKPYSLTYPGPDGKPVPERFKSMEAYGEWYENHPELTGGGTPHLEPEHGGAASAPAPGPRERASTGPARGAPTEPPTKQ